MKKMSWNKRARDMTEEEEGSNYLSNIGTPSPVKKARSSPRIVPSTSSQSPGAALPPSDGRMRVYVRVRPVNEKEHTGGNRIVVEPIDENLLVFDPVDEEPQYYYKGKTYKEPGKQTCKNMKFEFDRVFDEDSSNLEVYENVTKSLITAFLDGYNCAVFAYGATGSGKTHTMLGSPEDPGVIFFTTMELFRVIESRSEEEQLELSVSYFEIYNELVYDLLSPMVGKHLAVREDPKRGVVVANLSVHQPKDAQHLLDMLDFGNRNRTQSPTDANAESSRSHAVFQVFLKKRDFSSSQEMSIQLSKFSLIDLAGSERASVAFRENRNVKTRTEGGNINKSLLALGTCINALAEQSKSGRRKKVFIKYRDSKLTLLLRDSLGGNCHTAMIAAVSPSSFSKNDTKNTLEYANRAKGIQLNLRKNNISVGLQPRNYNAALESMSKKNQELLEENAYLKSELNRLKSQVPLNVPKNPIISSGTAIDALNEYKNQLEVLFNERIKVRKEFMAAESGLKKQDLKIMFKKLEAERINAMANADRISNMDETYRVTTSSRSTDQRSSEQQDFDDRNNFASLHSKKLHFIDAKKSAEERLKENQQAIDEIESIIRSKVGTFDWVIDTYFKDKNLMTEIQDRCFADKHSTEVAKWLIERLETNEDQILEAVGLIKHVHKMLSGMNRLTDDLDDKITSLQKRIEGKKSVVWRDNPNERIFKSVGRNEIESIFNLTIFYGGVITPAPSRKSRQLTSICSGLTPSSFTSLKGGSTVTKGKAPLRERIIMESNLHFS